VSKGFNSIKWKFSSLHRASDYLESKQAMKGRYNRLLKRAIN
jgi:hypothetical protein